MRDDGAAFWQELRANVARWERHAQLPIEEAERRMADAAEDPLSEEQIESIVRVATAGREMRPVSTTPRPRRYSWAALFLGGSLLLMAGVAVTALWSGSRKSVDTLDYRDAIQILVDPGETQARRESAQFRVFNLVRRGIRTLNEVRNRGDELQRYAESLLRELENLLLGVQTFQPRKLGARLESVAERVLDSTLPIPEQLAWQRALADQTGHGILALKKVWANPETLPVRTDPAVPLDRLAREFDG